MEEMICMHSGGCARLEDSLPNFDLTIYNPTT